jgi:hypothetical protein
VLAFEISSSKPAGRPLGLSPDLQMQYSKVAGVSNQVSRIVLGSMIVDLSRQPDSFALLDFFFERGGNCVPMTKQKGKKESLWSACSALAFSKRHGLSLFRSGLLVAYAGSTCAWVEFPKPDAPSQPGFPEPQPFRCRIACPSAAEACEAPRVRKFTCRRVLIVEIFVSQHQAVPVG